MANSSRDERSSELKLYFIHCGFYDEEISDGIYEFHVNIPVLALHVEEAKGKVRQKPQFVLKRMHIDGIQEILSVDEHVLTFSKARTPGPTVIDIPHRDF